MTAQARYTLGDLNTTNTASSPAFNGTYSHPLETNTPFPVTHIIRQPVTADVPPSCLRNSPRVSDDLANVNARPLLPTTALANGTGSVYCLYNVSRFRKARGHDFLTVHVPWWFCSRLIYWSVGIENGKLASRAPNFDSRYGLYKLREIANAHRADLELLVTIGGYPEDTGQFYALGSGTNSSYSLARDVAEIVYYTGFNGANIHMAHDRSCEGHFKWRFRWLSDFVDVLLERIRNSFAGFPFKIAVMIDANRKEARNYAWKLRGRVDLVFYDTHNLISATGSIETYCLKYGFWTENFMRELGNFRNTTICRSLSFIMPSRSNSDPSVPSTAHVLSKREGFASRLDFCVEKRTVVNGSDISGCTTYRSGSPWEVSVFPDRSALRKAFDETCLWLLDIDFDSYNSTECPYLGSWAMLREVYAALTP
ncbi:hypothetical protein HPB50_002435 [Hyalomma asiaticum]|uniref:Uncharacterized protein n=1 Tax=Hyalomma asiaticum TaxID=266040 RepID=A0ACB7SDK1_HYAAI|nr:hypothetical protein HPB50_002435 [Hyalomma asiaticum]